MLASAFAATGCKTGLYTSPHILDFRERMRIVSEVRGDNPKAENKGPWPSGYSPDKPIWSLVPKEYVFQFLKQWAGTFDRLRLSFFEITTGMAFKWFADEGVDVAVIEVGLGGRLDSTNVITPELSIITSIGLDHCDLLGDSLEKIAYEKAGIIKPGVPVVIGEYRPETAPVFRQVASERKSPIFFAEESGLRTVYPKAETSQIRLDLQGEYQRANLRTVLTALGVLGMPGRAGHDEGPSLPAATGNLTAAVREAIAHTAARTGFGGRWEHLSEDPLVICDIGHNAHALSHNFPQLEGMMESGVYDCLIIVYAVMADKDLDAILPLMPRCAHYIFTTPKGKRALPAAKIQEKYDDYGLRTVYPKAAVAIDDVQEAVREALKTASAYKKPIIYIGGSTFAVAEAKPIFQKEANQK
ncbi:MAG: Mur ligase family protein [Bacteroidales bacterium]|nr:Mur ligase family protein [Bacteroidales bacterium]